MIKLSQFFIILMELKSTSVSFWFSVEGEKQEMLTAVDWGYAQLSLHKLLNFAQKATNKK